MARPGTTVGQTHGARRRVWRAALFVLAVASAAPGPAAAAPQHNPKGRFLGVVKSARASERPTPQAQTQAQLATGDLAWHGGPVMHSNRTHTIYWEPSGFSTTASYKSAINGYLGDVAADSGRHSNVYASDVQYTDGGGNAAYSSIFAGSIVVNDPYPASGCTDSDPDTSVCLSDAQIQAEVNQVVAANGLPRGLGDIYFVMTPQGVGGCFGTTASSGCAYSYYCAYHSSFGSGAGETLYANQPYADVSGCDSGQQPNGGAADSTVNLISHEHNEAITDPRGDAWYDSSSGDENGDKCVWDFGTALGSTGSGQYNQLINGGRYYLQQEWSNASHSCVLTMSDNAPTASFTSTPLSPTTGQAASFDGSASSDSDGTISSYSWDFGDGATGSGATPSHSYATAGTYAVKLTVTDNDGSSGNLTQSVAVAQSTGSAPVGGGRATTGPVAGARLVIPTQRLSLSSARATRVLVQCGSGRRCAGTLTLSMTVPVTGRGGSRTRILVLGTTRFSVAALHAVIVPFRLRRVVATLLKGHHRIRVRAAAVVANAVAGRASIARSVWLAPAAKPTPRRS
jgi:PKD domain-containing protein